MFSVKFSIDFHEWSPLAPVTQIGLVSVTCEISVKSMFIYIVKYYSIQQINVRS